METGDPVLQGILDDCHADLLRHGLGEHQATAAALWITSVWVGYQDESSFEPFIEMTGGERTWSSEQKEYLLAIVRLHPPISSTPAPPPPDPRSTSPPAAPQPARRPPRPPP